MAQKLSPNMLAVLMLGILSQISQVLLLREFLVVFHGNELSIGLILAAWLLWIGIGSRLGAFLTARITTYNPLSFLKITSLICIFLLPGSLLLIRILRGFFDILPGAYLALTDMAISVFLLMAPLCLLLGSQFVWFSKVWREFLETKDTTGAEKAYIGEAAGNMAGGILFTFVMVHLLNPFQSAVLVSGLMLITVLYLGDKQANKQTKIERIGFKSSPVFISLLLLAILVSFHFLESLDKWAHQLQWQDFALQHELISTHQSEHGIIFISQHEEQYSFFQNGHLLFSTASPIERKPFYHVLPGSRALSVSTAGCNLQCKFCEVWDMALEYPEDVFAYDVDPEKIIRYAREAGLPSISYAFGEPVIFYEYMDDTATIAKEKGYLNLVHTAGYIQPEPLEKIIHKIDAVNVDLKSFEPEFYREVVGGELEPVLKSLKLLKDAGVHIEITNITIPNLNDKMDMIKEMCEWIVQELDDNIPLHFSRFYPLYKLSDLPRTPVSTLEEARKTAMDAGLKFVYIAKVTNHEGENTFCPECEQVVIKRMGFVIEELNLQGGACSYCGFDIPGIWDN